MTFKGYAARIEYDDEDALFVGRVAGITRRCVAKTSDPAV